MSIHLCICRYERTVSPVRYLFKVSDPDSGCNSPSLSGPVPVSALTLATQRQESSVTRSLLDLNARDTSGKTALHHAALQGDLAAIDYLVKAANSRPDATPNTLDVNAQDDDGKTPLYLAVEMQFSDVVRRLLRLGADANLEANNGKLPLTLAVNKGGFECLSVLIKELYAGELDDETDDGSERRTIGNDGVDSSLTMDEPADLDSDCYDCGDSQFEDNSHSLVTREEEMTSGAIEFTIQAMQDGDLDDSGTSISTPSRKYKVQPQQKTHISNELEATDFETLTSALANPKCEQPRILELIENIRDLSMINWCTEKRQHPIHIAAQHRRETVLRHLRMAGANPNVTDSKGNTALHYAVKVADLKSIKNLVYDVSSDELKWAKLRGWPTERKEVNLDVLNHQGKTPLFLAVEARKTDVVRLLIKFGADPNVGERSAGVTPLHLAVERGDYDAVEALLSSNSIEINQETSAGRSALDIAESHVRRNEVLIKLLLENGAEKCLSSEDEDESDEDCYSTSGDSNADVEMPDDV